MKKMLQDTVPVTAFVPVDSVSRLLLQQTFGCGGVLSCVGVGQISEGVGRCCQQNQQQQQAQEQQHQCQNAASTVALVVEHS